MKKRVDKVLVENGLIHSRSQAKLLIDERVVYYKDVLVTKCGELVEVDGLEVRKDNIYVGRAAHKLEKAVSEFKVNVVDKVIADIGASTGGFTDLLLRSGAKKVFAVDVGTGQLHPSLCNDPRVINLEKTNVRELDSLSEKVDLCVVDLSYISLKLVMKKIFSYLKENGEVVALIKPQFEVGKDGIGKNGIVKSIKLREDILKELYTWFNDNGFIVSGAIESPIAGKSGNIEYLFCLTTDRTRAITISELIKLF